MKENNEQTNSGKEPKLLNVGDRIFILDHNDNYVRTISIEQVSNVAAFGGTSIFEREIKEEGQVKEIADPRRLPYRKLTYSIETEELLLQDEKQRLITSLTKAIKSFDKEKVAQLREFAIKLSLEGTLTTENFTQNKDSVSEDVEEHYVSDESVVPLSHIRLTNQSDSDLNSIPEFDPDSLRD